jgi:hypothetical protein
VLIFDWDVANVQAFLAVAQALPAGAPPPPFALGAAGIAGACRQ